MEKLDLETKLLELRKQQFDVMITYLDELVEKLSSEVNDEEANFTNLHLEMESSLNAGEYNKVRSLTNKIIRVETNLYKKKDKLEKATKLQEETKEYISDISKYSAKAIGRIQAYLEDDINSLEKSVIKKTPIKPDNTLFDEAEKLVSIAENEMTEEALQKAKDAVLSLNDGDIKTKLEARITTCEKELLKAKALEDANQLVETLEIEMTKEALQKAKDAISNLDDSDIKTKLEARITTCEKELLKAKALEDANQLVETLEIEMTKEALQKAKDAISNLDDSDIKTKLEARITTCEKELLKAKALEDANQLVETLEIEMTKEALQKAINAISNLDDSDIKTSLASRISICEKEIKRREIYIENLRIATEQVEDAKKTHDAGKLELAKKNVIALDDSTEKDNLLKEIDLIEFEIVLEDCQRAVANDEVINNDEIKKLIDIYRKLDDSEKSKYINDLNRVISTNNLWEQSLYQEKELTNNNKAKKYGFFTKFSEFVSGGVINAITGSKLYKKHLDKKLKKAQDSKDTKKIAKVERKIDELGIVNGIRLFTKRNVIASLRPKLYKEESEKLSGVKKTRFESRENRYNKAVNYISKKMSKKLDKITQDESIFDNKNIVKNIIMQYLDTLATTSDEYKDKISEEAIEFIESAYTKGAISESEQLAYKQEIKNITEFNEIYSLGYDIDFDDIDNMVKYYDEDAIAKDVVYVKRGK